MAVVQHSLRIGINGSGARAGAAEVVGALESVRKKSGETLKDLETGTRGATGSLSLLKTALGGLAVSALARGLLEVTKSYESLKASLVTATGSASGANIAFEKLKEFAKTTPFTLEGATQAYNRLASAGLTPTIEKLRAFGDIASSISGKTIIDFVEAVADATQGQDKRLKEFGINMTAMGDKMQIAFGKTKTIVENNAQAIEAALVSLAQTRFGGAMALQAQTLGGALSNLEDSVSIFAYEISQGGLSEALRDLVVRFSDMVGGSDKLAEAIGYGLGQAVKGLSAGVEFLVRVWDQLAVVARIFISVGAVIWFARLATAIWGTVIALNAQTLALASNPFGVIAVGITAAIAYFVDWNKVLGLTANETDAVEKKTESMIKRFKDVDPNSLEEVLAASEDISKELANTNDQLVLAGGNMKALSTQAAILKAIETESLNGVLDLISKIQEESGAKVNAQEAGIQFTDPVDIQIQIDTLKAKRGEMKKELLGYGMDIKAAKALLAGDIKQTVTETISTQGTTFTSQREVTAEADPEKVRGLAREFMQLNSDLAANMNEITALEQKQHTKGLKVAKKDADRSVKVATKEADDLAGALRDIETDAAMAQNQLALTMKTADPTELKKLLVFQELYNKVTKNDTIPITQEQIDRLRVAVGVQVEAEKALDDLNQTKQKEIDLAKELAEAEKERTKVKAEAFGDISGALASARAQLGILGDIGEAQEQIDKAKQKFTELQYASLQLTGEELSMLAKQTEAIEAAQKRVEQLKTLQPFTTFIKDNNDLMANLADFGVSAINKLTDVWVEFTQTGKLNFKDFADFVFAEITKMIAKFLIAAALQAALTAFFPAAGAAGGVAKAIIPGSAGASPAASIFAGVAHSGGVTDRLRDNKWVSGSVFSNAPRYHDGGIAGLQAGEIPAILKPQEAVIPLKGGAVPVEITDKNKNAKQTIENHRAITNNITNNYQNNPVVVEQAPGKNSGGGDTYNITIQVYGAKDADSFRKSIPQINKEIIRGINTSRKRNT